MDRSPPTSSLAQRTWLVLARARGRLAIAAAAAALAASAHAAIVVAAGMLARQSLGGGALEGGGPSHPLLAWATLGIVAAAIKLVAGATVVHAESRLASEVACELRQDVLLAWLEGDRARAPRQVDHGLAESVSPRDESWGTHALTGRTEAIERGVAAGVFGTLRASLELAPLVVLLVVLGSRVAWVIVAMLAPLGAAVALMRRWSRRSAAAVTASELEVQELVERAVRHRALWTVYGASTRVASLLGRASLRAAVAAARYRVAAALASAANELLAAVALLVALLAARRGWLGPIDGVSLLSFCAVFFLAYRPLRQLGDARVGWQRACVAFDGLARLAERGAELRASMTVERASTQWRRGELVLTGVRTRHGKHGPLSLSVPPGSLVAVVGATGSGKSSLLACLLGLEPALEGRVHYGDVDVTARPAGLDSRPFAWLPQHAPVLRGTLAENIAVGGPADSASVEDLRVMGRLPQPDAELAGARRALSGGESQWLGLARAVASSAPVLLLDEPTSALDAESQRAFIAALVTLSRTRTVLVVTHSTALRAVATHVVDLGDHEASGGACGPDGGPPRAESPVAVGHRAS